MSKRSPRLQFTEEELSAPKVAKAAGKAEKRVDKLEKAEQKIPKKVVKRKMHTVDPASGAITTRILFEETDKKCPPSKLTHKVLDAPGRTLSSAAHREMRDSEEDNVGVEAANKLETAAEHSVRFAESAHHSHKLKPYRRAERAEKRTDSANLKALYKNAEAKNPESFSNPYSRWQQRRAIRKEYAAAKAGTAAQNTVKAGETTAKAAKRAAADGKKAGEFIAQHKKGFLIAGAIGLMLVMLLNVVSSCSVLVQGGTSAIGISTYPSEDADMLAAEAQYCAMEAELQAKLDNYEADHDYDEYHYDLDEISHDPYVLISAITALHGGAWKVDEVGGILQMLFDKQYILTETVEAETRYRTETETGSYPYYDDTTGQWITVEYEYEVQVPYTYTICTVKLENFNLSHVPVYIMSQDQLSLYATYMATLGNRPDLFGDSEYIGKYYTTQHPNYEISPEALEDEQFAAIIKEAEKYIGFPYVWGGSSPTTSFDCSGFVSYVYNNCGVGWNFGRLGAEGLRQMCAYVSPANAKPGDLIFFQGTYDTAGASHVGIYVGNSQMLHCGDPIQYSDISSSYWQQHFYQFGRLPSP